MFFGPTRSGKSMSIIVPNLQSLRRSLIVTDPKGELAAITLRHRKTMGKTIVLNPFGVLTRARPDLESVGWNPLAQLDPQSPDFAGDAMCIADAIVEKTAGDGHNKFFDEYAQNLVQAVVMWERDRNGDDANLRNIRSLMADDKSFEHMARSRNRAIREMGEDIHKRVTDKDSQKTSIRDVIETLKKNLAFLNDNRIGYDMARGGAIDFAALHREITTIYVILPAEELRDQARWLRLFVNLALRKLYKCAPAEDAPATLPPALFILDEFGNLGRLGEIVKGLNMGCFCRFQLMFFLQNLGQLTGAYKDELGSFFSNAGAVSTFKTGAMDIETSEHLSKAFGNQEMRVQTQTERGGSLTPQPVPLRRAEDIARLQPQVTMNIVEPCPWPMYAWTPIYDPPPRRLAMASIAPSAMSATPSAMRLKPLWRAEQNIWKRVQMAVVRLLT
jgi:type IV secretion system protein VirD4